MSTAYHSPHSDANLSAPDSIQPPPAAQRLLLPLGLTVDYAVRQIDVRRVETPLAVSHNIDMGNAANIWGTKVVSLADAVVAYCDADETGRALIETTGVTAKSVEADYSGPSAEADSGWDF